MHARTRQGWLVGIGIGGLRINIPPQLGHCTGGKTEAQKGEMHLLHAFSGGRACYLTPGNKGAAEVLVFDRQECPWPEGKHT